MADPLPLDSNWLADHPVPAVDPSADKNSRGRVLAVGGCARVPGGLLLTAEAALRAGAGKLQLGTIADAAIPLGVALPEAAVIALDADEAGEIAGPNRLLAAAWENCDAAVIGPAMIDGAAAGRLLDALLSEPAPRRPEPGEWRGPETLVLDAACLLSLAARRTGAAALPSALILTPHLGEMAALLGCDASTVAADLHGAARQAARAFGAVVALKGPTTFVARPDGQMLAYAGGGAGLATGGSGDVLAGLAAGLAARGAEPWIAAAWAVWLHGEAGRRCAESIGPIGYLARELLRLVPALMPVR